MWRVSAVCSSYAAILELQRVCHTWLSQQERGHTQTQADCIYVLFPGALISQGVISVIATADNC